MASNNIDEDEQFNQAFGEHTSISKDCRRMIGFVRDVDIVIKRFMLHPHEAIHFSDLAWRLLGRYIANNKSVEELELDGSGIADQNMALLFEELTFSTSLKELDMRNNHTFGNAELGVDIRTMIPFLENYPDLCQIFFNNNHFNSECFELLVSALRIKGVKNLHLQNCNITNISALETYTIPNLYTLNLDQNNIGMEGCITLSNLLQREGSSLTHLLLADTGIGDEEVELLANSLEDNTKLKELNLEGNYKITVKGRRALLKLLVDISSIETTYNSNCTLTSCYLDQILTNKFQEMKLNNDVRLWIKHACLDNNRDSTDSHDARRNKVIQYQFNSQNRKKVCELQGVEYLDSNVFADIEPVLLPKILASIGREHGQSELYTALINTAPDLMSFIDRKAMIKDQMARNLAKATTLKQQADALIRQASVIDAENDLLSSRLTLIDLGDMKRSAVGG